MLWIAWPYLGTAERIMNFAYRRGWAKAKDKESLLHVGGLAFAMGLLTIAAFIAICAALAKEIPML